MDLLNIFAIAVGLSMDAFAVSIATGLGLAKVTRRHVFRMAFHFGLFQFMMPVIGFFAGSYLAGSIKQYDHLVAFGLLSFVGGKMLWEARQLKEERIATDPTRGAMLVTLSIATSIDALAVGGGMAMLRTPETNLGVSLWLPCVVIGVVTGFLSMVGILFSGRIGSRWSRWAEIVGGVVLILIGLNILRSHLMS